MRPSPLVTRIVIATTLGITAVAVGSAVLLGTVTSLQRANRREASSREVTVAALRVQTLVVDLETGLRGYAITADQRFLRPWYEARRRLPEATARLEQLAADDRVQRRRAREVVGLIDEYETDFGEPLLRIARVSPAAARASIADDEDRRRVGTLRALLQRFLATEVRRSEQRAATSLSGSQRAETVTRAALGASALFIVLFASYVGRSVVRPIKRVAEAAKQVAAGDLAVRATEGGAGEVRELTVAFNSMTATLEQARRELLERNTLLVASEQHKSELITMVSHELRTPLASVVGFTRLLLQRQFDEEERERYLRIIDTEARRLATLANDFLEAQHVEEGRFALNTELHDLAESVRAQIALFFGPGVTHELTARIPARPVVSRIDPDRIAQVIGNLLSNAIKYSPPGSLVEVDLEELDGMARLSVRDHGFGIPVEHQARIFTKFFRGSAVSAGISGTGLGLAVARELVHAHGGRLEFTSVEESGSTFWIELPVAESGADHTAGAASTASSTS